jgi:hypothetical protein
VPDEDEERSHVSAVGFAVAPQALETKLRQGLVRAREQLLQKS